MPAEALQSQQSLVSGIPGGYWNSCVVDHVLLVNVYFPDQMFLDELAQALPVLISAYPSPHWRLSEYVGQVIGQDAERIVVGNGVAELITILIGRFGLRVAVPTPSFNPYERAAPPSGLFRFELPSPNFDLDVDAFFEEANAYGIDAAVVVSPNNPTARAVPRRDLVRLVGRLAERGKKLILDESFIEFTDQGRGSSLEPEISRFPNLIILKSLGKTYGIGGLRLGYLLTSDLELTRDVRAAMQTWTVNSIGEFFLSKLNSLQPAAQESWARVRQDRDQLFDMLRDVPGLSALKPQANFVLCHLQPSWPDGRVVAERLLTEHSTLIRHLGGKTMKDGTRYLRIAARTQTENERLADCLKNLAPAAVASSRHPPAHRQRLS